MLRKSLAMLLAVFALTGQVSLSHAQAPPQVIQLVQAEGSVIDAAACPTDCCTSCCDEQPFGLRLGLRTWFSWANTDDLAGDSLFRFRDNYSTVYEFNVDANWNRLVTRLDLGLGAVDEGTWQNQEPGESPLPQDVAGDDLFYFTADFGWRLIDRGTLGGDCPRGCAVDLLTGYQHWRETYDVVDPNGFSDEYDWNSLRLGGRAILARNRLTLQARLMFSPYNEFESTATGGLNYGLEGDGGWGVFSDFSASYRLWNHVSAELGYQVFYLKSDGGDDGSLAFDEVEMVRHGLLLGINWRF